MNDLEANRDTWPDVYVTVETKELEDLRTRLQAAEQQLANTQREFGRIQGTSAKQVVDRFLDLMRKLNEKDLPAGFESWEAFLKHIDGIKQRAVAAEQQLGQVREEVTKTFQVAHDAITNLKDAAEKLDRYANRQTARRLRGKSLNQGLEDNSSNEGHHYPQIQSCIDRCKDNAKRLKAALSATPSDGCGKGQTDKEPTYPCDDCGALRTEAQGGTTFTVCDECWDKGNMEAASSKGKEGGE